ncbi:MAG TPA: aminoglycoside phosphotransferase [Gammaproteobacteria bacterium]|nr:aminoglycoside phosphotransferase [Gammaproteobacteria bacterium]HIL97287.1 aminoglycoside phosphotransferase [Pseudomonadales bacterium]
MGNEFRLYPASDDASFRRYFRGQAASGSYIFVDAPPEKEDNPTFVQIARLLGDNGLNAPRVYDVDFSAGYMMLSDLGDELYLDALQTGDKERTAGLYSAALTTLTKFSKVETSGLPVYSESVLRQEMDLFPDWFLAKQMGVSLQPDERRHLESVFQLMVTNALEQPLVFVHRDFHCRNLMITEENSPGIIDFQDAIKGPVTYDLVSLLKDCYWRFPRHEVVTRVKGYWQMLEPDVNFEHFMRWFDLMGLQRHIKCAGIFSRLHLRDFKSNYLHDIPLVMEYILEVCREYDEVSAFGQWLQARILPDLAVRLNTARPLTERRSKTTISTQPISEGPGSEGPGSEGDNP